MSYLQDRISRVLGSADAVQVIHGSMGREDRMKAQEAFKHDPSVRVLVATDAAGEGINLQRAHLMVNYDLPWNPNRIEQRFGRIHRIGQTEPCHLWNLVADETREGDVYRRLLEKLAEARNALGGEVYDVLGRVQFDGKPLRELLISAIRYGEQPEVRAYLTTVVEQAMDREQLQSLIEDKVLDPTIMDASKVQRVREDMERADARRLQPHYIESFFLEAFSLLGGRASQRESSALRGDPCAGIRAEPRPADRHRRTRSSAIRAHRLREGADRAAGPADGGVRLSRSSVAGCDAGPDAGDESRPAEAWRCPG